MMLPHHILILLRLNKEHIPTEFFLNDDHKEAMQVQEQVSERRRDGSLKPNHFFKSRDLGWKSVFLEF